MKKRLLTMFLFIATFNLVAQTNLVPNGDMENWDSFDTNPDDWYRFIDGFWSKSPDAQNGSSSLQLEIDSGRTFIFINTPNMQFTNGVTYLCTFYYKVVSGTVDKFEFNLSHIQGAFPANLVANDFTDLSTTEWKKGEFQFTSSATEDVQAYIYVRGTAGSKALIDNVSIIDMAGLSISESTGVTNEFQVYPNPSSNYIVIYGMKHMQHYTIYNTLGKVVDKGQVSEKKQIDISKLSKGLYLLMNENGRTLKFIKE